LCTNSSQGFPSNDSNDKWDGAIAQTWGRKDQRHDDQEPPPIDTDINICEAMQQAFHVYDDAGAGEDPLAREANAERVDVDSHLEGALDTESLSMDDDDNLPNPHSGA
jgi:hypothetical protein